MMTLDDLIGSPPYTLRLWATGGGNPSNDQYATFEEVMLEANAKYDRDEWVCTIFDGNGRELPLELWRIRRWFGGEDVISPRSPYFGIGVN